MRSLANCDLFSFSFLFSRELEFPFLPLAMLLVMFVCNTVTLYFCD